MTTVLGGLLNTSYSVAYGMAGPIVGVGNIIDITLLANTSFSVPRDGTIKSLSGVFNTTVALSLIGSTATITGQLYSAPATSNSFTAVPGASVTLTPSLTGLLAIGTIAAGMTTGLNIPVTAGTRLLLVFSPKITAGLDLAAAFTGNISAGLAID